MSRRLCIALMTDYLGSLAGTEASLVGTALALRERGHEVVVGAFCRDAPVHPYWRGRLEAGGIAVGVFGGSNGDADGEGEACRAMATWLSARPPDILHFIPAGDLARTWFRRALLPGVPVVGTETSEASPRCFWYSREHFPALARFDALVAPCATVAAGIRDYFGYPGRVEVVPHVVPIEEGEMRPLERSELVRAPHLGAITRLRVEKGPEFLVAALAIAAKSVPGLSLTVYGETPERERTRAVATALGVDDRLEIAGPFHDTTDIGAIVQRHPLFVLSSLFESLPLAVLHVAARGRVTVATDAGGVREFFADVDEGLVVARGDPAAMAAAIVRLLRHPESLVESGRRSLAKFRAAYHPDTVVPRLLRLYHDVIARPRSTSPMLT